MRGWMDRTAGGRTDGRVLGGRVACGSGTAPYCCARVLPESFLFKHCDSTVTEALTGGRSPSASAKTLDRGASRTCQSGAVRERRHFAPLRSGGAGT